MRDYLFTSIKIDQSDPFEVKQLIDDLKKQKTIKTKVIEKQVKKAVAHYTAQHGHGLPRNILTFSVRQHTYKLNKKI